MKLGNKIVDWLNKPVTFNILIKLLICINLIFLSQCYTIAVIGDIKDKEQQEYEKHLEEQIKLQKEIITLLQKVK